MYIIDGFLDHHILYAASTEVFHHALQPMLIMLPLLSQAVQALPSSVRQSCILDKTGALFFDSSARILYRCDGASWVRWKKPKSRSKAGSDSPALPCRKNWKSFANRFENLFLLNVVLDWLRPGTSLPMKAIHKHIFAALRRFSCT